MAGRPRSLKTWWKIGLSLLRRRVPALRQVVVPYDEGRSRIIADLGTALGLGLYRYGHHDPEIDLVGQLLQPGDVFIDGGAHVGLYTLVAAQRVGPAGAVIAFEPGHWARSHLEKSLALNRFNWVTLHGKALADAPGLVEMTVFSGEGAAFSSFQPALSGGTVERVQAVRLDDMVPAGLRSRLALVKLDLEGAEYRALQGAKDILKVTGPDFLIELDADNLGRHGSSVEDVVELFRGLGYQFYIPVPGPSGLVLTETPVSELPRSVPNLWVMKNPGRLRRRGMAIREQT